MCVAFPMFFAVEAPAGNQKSRLRALRVLKCFLLKTSSCISDRWEWLLLVKLLPFFYSFQFIHKRAIQPLLRRSLAEKMNCFSTSTHLWSVNNPCLSLQFQVDYNYLTWLLWRRPLAVTEFHSRLQSLTSIICQWSSDTLPLYLTIYELFAIFNSPLTRITWLQGQIANDFIGRIPDHGKLALGDPNESWYMRDLLRRVLRTNRDGSNCRACKSICSMVREKKG